MLTEAAVMLDANDDPTDNPEEAVLVRYIGVNEDGTFETYDTYITDQTDQAETDDTEDESIEVEKGILGSAASIAGKFAGRAIQYFKGSPGYWVTREGRRVFVDVKSAETLATGTLKVSTTVEKLKGSIAEVEQIVNAHPASALRCIKEVKLSNNLGPTVLGQFNPTTKVLEINTALIKEHATAKYLAETHKGNVKTVDAYYKFYLENTISHEIGHAIALGSASLNRLSVSYRYMAGKTSFYEMTPAMRSFVDASIREGGATQYSHNVLAQTNRAVYDSLKVEPHPTSRIYNTINDQLKKIALTYRDNYFGSENFAEVYATWQIRSRYPKGWETLTKKKPKTVETFLKVLEDLNG